MEGVLVTAKMEGGTVTQTVVTNDKGQFSFPAGKLEAGKYTLAIRAAGYTLVGPKSVDVTASGVTADIKLAKARNVAAQLCSTARAAIPCNAFSAPCIAPTNGSRSSRAWAAMRLKAHRPTRS